MTITLESFSNDFLLQTLQDRGVKIRQCSFIDDDEFSILGRMCEKYGIYKKDEFPVFATESSHPATTKPSYPICYCPEHRELLRNGNHQGWCTTHVILPNGDMARCQHTGAFSWEHKRYLCKEHATIETNEIPRAT
jgi:hypothetical protein